MQFVSEEKKEADPYFTLSLDKFEIIGKSIAGMETVFAIPQWNLCFDTGRAPAFAIAQDYLALTHWHLDHAGGLPHFLSLRCLNGLPPLHIIVPPEKVMETNEFLLLLKKTADSKLSFVTHSSLEKITLQKGLTLEGVPNFHCTPSTGYLVVQSKQKLLPEFQNSSQDDIMKAKNAGKTITQASEVPLLAFSGDSKGEFLTTAAAKAQFLLMECTFFEEEVNVQKIKDYGHAHIQDWKTHADKIESDVVIMTHTSRRYSRAEIEAACQKHLPKSLLNKLIIFR